MPGSVGSSVTILRTLAADALGIDPTALDVDAALATLGLDSLAAETIVDSLARHGIHLPQELLLTSDATITMLAAVCTRGAAGGVGPIASPPSWRIADLSSSRLPSCTGSRPWRT